MEPIAAATLLKLRCLIPDLVPQYWNTYEPVKRPFDPTRLEECIEGLCTVNDKISRTSVLLEKRTKPKFWGDIELLRRPQHNKIFVGMNEPWHSGEWKLVELVRNYAEIAKSDHGFVADPDRIDVSRYDELMVPYTAEEIRLGVRRGHPFIPGPRRGKDGLVRYWYFPTVDEMYGPHGYLWDIVWYNYFGPPYVELIGKDRLLAAGWARVNELAGGYECYATERIDDPLQREKRAAIRDALYEFVWTPGCKREEKLAPIFDFSAQLVHAPEAVKNPDPNAGKMIIFKGLTKEQEQQAVKVLEEQTGKQFDPVSKLLKPRVNKN
jgi:hypothetical protein